MFVHVLVLGIVRIKKYLDTHPTLYISIYEPGLFNSLVLQYIYVYWLDQFPTRPKLGYTSGLYSSSRVFLIFNLEKTVTKSCNQTFTHYPRAITS